MFVVELPKSNKLFSKDEIAEVLSQPEPKLPIMSLPRARARQRY